MHSALNQQASATMNSEQSIKNVLGGEYSVRTSMNLCDELSASLEAFASLVGSINDLEDRLSPIVMPAGIGGLSGEQCAQSLPSALQSAADLRRAIDQQIGRVNDLRIRVRL